MAFRIVRFVQLGSENNTLIHNLAMSLSAQCPSRVSCLAALYRRRTRKCNKSEHVTTRSQLTCRDEPTSMPSG